MKINKQLKKKNFEIFLDGLDRYHVHYKDNHIGKFKKSGAFYLLNSEWDGYVAETIYLRTVEQARALMKAYKRYLIRDIREKRRDRERYKLACEVVKIK